MWLLKAFMAFTLLILLALNASASVIYPQMSAIWTFEESGYPYIRACEHASGALSVIVEVVPPQPLAQPSRLYLLSLKDGRSPEVSAVEELPPVSHLPSYHLAMKSYAVLDGKGFTLGFEGRGDRWWLTLKRLGDRRALKLMGFRLGDLPPLPIALARVGDQLVAGYHVGSAIRVDLVGGDLRLRARYVIAPKRPVSKEAGLIVGELSGEPLIAFKDVADTSLVACVISEGRGCVSLKADVKPGDEITWLGEVTRGISLMALTREGQMGLDLRLVSLSLEGKTLRSHEPIRVRGFRGMRVIGMLRGGEGIALLGLVASPDGDGVLSLSPGLRGWHAPVRYLMSLPWRGMITSFCAIANDESMAQLIALAIPGDKVPERLYLLRIEPRSVKGGGAHELDER